MLETAIISCANTDKLELSVMNKVKVFSEAPERFAFVGFVSKVMFFAPALIFLGVWSSGKISMILLSLAIVVISLFLLCKSKNFSSRNPEFVIKNFQLLFYLFIFVFKASRFLPDKVVSLLSSRNVELMKRELEFIFNNVNTKETLDEDILIKNVLKFNDKTVKEIMVPRTKVVALDINAPREKVIKVVLNEGYSRLPVYKDTIDNIVGVIYAKDLINYIEEPNLFILYDLLRPAYFVPETKKISELLRELQKNKVHMAIVVDEFGGFEGIVTLEDILEEIVGEIHDEYDKVEESFKVLDNGAIIVDAGMLVGDFNRRFGEYIPESAEYESIGGFVAKLFGRIPNEGEKINFKGLAFEVLKKSKRRVVEVRVTKESKL